MSPVIRALLVPVLLALSACGDWELHRKMEEMCKNDGGIKVHETVILPASEFNTVGQPLVKYERQANS